MEKRIDFVYADMPRCVLSGILGEVLADLNDLYREKCSDECSRSDDGSKSEPGFEEVLKDIGMKKWGPADDFEKLVMDLIERYDNQMSAILEGKELRDLESVSRKRIKEIDCKCSLAKAFFQSNTTLRITRSLGDPSAGKKLAIIPYDGNIYTAEILSEEELIKALKRNFGGKDKKDEVIPGYW